ncbi:MAG: dCMP deaminase family protein [Thaumarchaeota archaeon]|nr:dCMP deaminase family protein [Nitrososphaerota archaeon]MDD9843255.1 dCMP deaminase family protein [Nitrososphaerota archaeon]RNJ73069.1 MAG: deoxycytidylate deaminase [Thaumarchaeota archaeon S13]RNJ74928.1 MAG: deoxycytidylate deaminase [Thaumarchaeota archaeon S15]
MAHERPTWDEYFMLQAELAKLRSNCMAKRVGAVIVSGNRQIATGYNGTPPGVRNCHEGGCARCAERVRGEIASGEALERCLCNHAEANAIMHCAILGIRAGADGTAGATLYSTMVPCLECTKMAVTVGIRRVVCLEGYAESDMGLLGAAGAEVVRMDPAAIRRWAGEIAGARGPKNT